jgi:hypothetical protein
LESAHRRNWNRAFLTGAGSITAVVVLELILRFFVVGWHYPKTPIREIRQFTEGVATSHFAADGFGTYGHRLTGHAPIPGAPTVLLLGDSHLVQEAVQDEDTMGAVIERAATEAGSPVNVRQYGWYGAAAPTYIAFARDLMQATEPRVVVVLMNSGDFGMEALTRGWYWVMKIHPDLSIELIDTRTPEPRGWPAAVREFVGRSSLMLSLRRRAVLVFDGVAAPKFWTSAGPPSPDSRLAEIPLVARASVHGLKEAYGARLIIVYTPYCREVCEETPEKSEGDLLEVCRVEVVRCLSTRADMRSNGEAHPYILRGFHNTAPGAGHFNVHGLRVVGTAIWRSVRADVR